MAAREQGIACDDTRGDVAIIVAILAFVVISERAEVILFDERIQRAGSFRGAGKFGLFTFLRHVEVVAELSELDVHLFLRDGLAELVQRAHFDEFKMISEHGGLLRHVAVNVEHPAIIMAEHADAVRAHGG